MFGDRVYNRSMTRRDFLWLSMASTASPLLTSCSTNPVTGERQLMLMSKSQEIQIDQQQSPHQFSHDYGAIQDSTLNQYLSQIGNNLRTHTHRPKMPYSFRVVNANYINAYAFPGGSIAVTRGIMVNLNNEAELAGLLGHELGHINARHTAERMSKSTLLNLALAGAGMAVGQINPELGNITQQLGQISSAALLAHYSRDDERQADALGMAYMVKAHYTPEGMVGLMSLLRSLSKHKASAIDIMFSTHPMSDERFHTATHLSQTRYGFAQNYFLQRERFMDNTAALRRLKPVITKLEEAERLLVKKNYNDATALAQQAVKAAPSDYAALMTLGKSLSLQEKHHEALRYFDKATNVYPTEAQAHHLLGITQLELKKPEKALQQFNDYERLLAGNPNTYFLQGICHENMQNRPLAADRYTAYLKKVRQGQQAEYAYGRLVKWGYIQP